jgi:plastocyanin
MNKNLIALGVFVVLGVVAVSGCTSQSSANTVNIQNGSFSPTSLNVQVGTTVMWVNKANTAQGIASDNGLFTSGNLTNGMSYNYTFNQTGNYPYHSTVNPSMKGTIVVTASNSTGNSNSSGGSGGSGIKY